LPEVLSFKQRSVEIQSRELGADERVSFKLNVVAGLAVYNDHGHAFGSIGICSKE
jgi:hypothetical protein